MKIVHLVRRYAPLRGGVETHVAEINRVHRAAGHTITVITIQEEIPLKLQSTEEDISVWRIPRIPRLEKRERSWGYKTHLWKWLWQHRELLQQADVIQVHDVFWWLWPLIPLVTSKTFITFHGWEGQYPVRWQAKLQRWVANQLCQGVIHVGAWIQEFYGDQPDYVVYGGSDPHHRPKADLSANEAEDLELRLVFVGRLEAVNEVETYLQLLQLLRANGITFTMIWVGDGSYKERCEEFGTVTGMVENPVQFTQTADLVLANSYLTLLESQVTGAVVVAAYSNPLKKRYLETYPIQEGLVVGETAEQLFNQLQQLGADPEGWAAETKKAAATAKEYSWEKVAQTYGKLWHRKSKM